MCGYLGHFGLGYSFGYGARPPRSWRRAYIATAAAAFGARLVAPADLDFDSDFDLSGAAACGAQS